jgi:hypothetical protein
MLGCGCEGNQVSYLLGSPPSDFLYTCVGIIGLDFDYLMENHIGSPASVQGSNESSFFFLN